MLIKYLAGRTLGTSTCALEQTHKWRVPLVFHRMTYDHFCDEILNCVSAQLLGCFQGCVPDLESLIPSVPYRESKDDPTINS